MSGHDTHNEPKLFGMIAEFDTEDQILDAANKAYKAGFRSMDAYTPFPIHGLAEAIGFKKCAVAPIALIGGITGAVAGFAMQYYASVIHYPWDIGGKPDFSWPSFMPITFELTILFGAFGAFLSMIILNGLPQPYHPIFNAKRFERASNDGFFLCIEADDPQFDTATTREFLEGLGPVEVSEVMD